MLRKKRTVLYIVLIFIDIFIKIIIDSFFYEKELLINGKLGFTPYLNIDQVSTLNRVFHLDLNLNTMIILDIVAIVTCFVVKRHLERNAEGNEFMYLCFDFLMIAGICSLIDRVIWGGSLDYILVFAYIIDLKDVYLGVGAGCYIWGVLKLVWKKYAKYYNGGFNKFKAIWKKGE